MFLQTEQNEFKSLCYLNSPAITVPRFVIGRKRIGRKITAQRLFADVLNPFMRNLGYYLQPDHAIMCSHSNLTTEFDVLSLKISSLRRILIKLGFAAVSVLTGQGLNVNSFLGRRISFLPPRPNHFQGPNNLVFNGYGPERESNRSYSSGVEVKNPWSCISATMAWYQIKSQE